MLKECGTVLLYKQQETADAVACEQMFNLPPGSAEVISRLVKGTCLFKIGSHYPFKPSISAARSKVVVPAALAWVSAFFGEMPTPTGMPWTDFAALWAKIKAGEFLWPGASTWVLIVFSVLAIVGAGILSALFGSTKTRVDGLPRYTDLERRMGRKAALAKARQSLELPAEATEDEMIVALCKLDGQTLYVQHEDSMWVFAPHRSGKTHGQF